MVDQHGSSHRRECEECGASGARRMKVEYGDGQTNAFTLCQSCLTEYRAADLVEDISTLESDENASVE